jgi:hypothetical protein
MPRVKPLTVGSLMFPNQSLALVYFKEMLNRYIPGEQITEEDSPHLALLFERHPDYAAKSQPGIVRFEVMAGEYGTQCFCAIRKDGSKESFSYKRCVTQRAD